jgi:hypothetical protein
MKQIPVIDYDLVFIEWVDSRATHGWSTVDEIENTCVIVQSVGWKILENEELIVISGHYGKPPQPQFCGVMTIPKCCIKKIILLAKEKR